MTNDELNLDNILELIFEILSNENEANWNYSNFGLNGILALIRKHINVHFFKFQQALHHHWHKKIKIT